MPVMEAGRNVPNVTHPAAVPQSPLLLDRDRLRLAAIEQLAVRLFPGTEAQVAKRVRELRWDRPRAVQVLRSLIREAARRPLAAL